MKKAACRNLEVTSSCPGNIAWAFATLSIRDLPLLDVIAVEAIQRITHFNVQGMANTAWALAKARFIGIARWDKKDIMMPIHRKMQGDVGEILLSLSFSLMLFRIHFDLDTLCKLILYGRTIWHRSGKLNFTDVFDVAFNMTFDVSLTAGELPKHAFLPLHRCQCHGYDVILGSTSYSALVNGGCQFFDWEKLTSEVTIISLGNFGTHLLRLQGYCKSILGLCNH